MVKYISFILTGLLLVGLLTSCRRSSELYAPSNPAAYFKTPFKDETQFIVEAIVSDIAEQIYFARYDRLPDSSYFSIDATETANSPIDAPVYNVEIGLDSTHRGLKLQLTIDRPIWSPEVYQDLTSALAQYVGLNASNPNTTEDTDLLAKLTDGRPETIEEQNQELSKGLERDFTDPVLHEEAAVLLGAFTLRERSGYFYDIRYPLSRITAHLAMAQFLNGSNSYGINGKMANAMALTLAGDQAAALDQLKSISTNDPAAACFVRALWTRNTGDFRMLNQVNGLSRVESIEWDSAMARYLGGPVAWSKLSNSQMQNIDFVREAYQDDHSVEMGHQLMDAALPLEFQEVSTVYQLSQNKVLTQAQLIPALNVMPERCFSTIDGATHVRIIGWGQWAAFLQRQLCSAVEEDFNMLYYMWGVPDDAKSFANRCDQRLNGLRLYPFVRRFDCTDVQSYHQAVDDGFKVTIETPQLVPAECWNWLCYTVDFAPLYNPNPNPHVNEWHHHNPPPGTVYNLNPRLNHPSLIGRGDAVAFFEKLHQLAPYDSRIDNFIIEHKYNSHPTYDQAMELFSNVMPYSLAALRTGAWAVTNQPEQFEKLMLQAAQLNPASYYDLADYFAQRHQDDIAAGYYDNGCTNDSDAVEAASYGLWRVRYYVRKGQMDKARQVADFGAEVYSSIGLRSEALFFELTSNYDEAFDWYTTNEDRYDESDPVVDFCIRYKAMTRDDRFDSELQKRIKKFFPKGIEHVSLADFGNTPPSDGTWVRGENNLTKAAGLKTGDVIVAVYGMRVHNFKQYMFGREWETGPALDLIVWQGDGYHNITANLPDDHRFGVDFDNYPPNAN